MMGLIPKLSDPKKVIDTNHTFLVYGPPGCGKTTLMAGLTDSLIIDTEKGSTLQRAHRIECKDWVTFQNVVKELSRRPPEFKNICIDTVGPLLNSCMNYVSKNIGVGHPSEAQYGKGWHLIKETVKTVFLQLQHLPCNVWFVLHSQVKKIEGVTDYDYTQPELPGFLENLFLGLCDFIFMVDMEAKAERDADGKMIGRKNTRILRTKPNKFWMAKDRLVETTLPEKIDLNAEALMLALHYCFNNGNDTTDD